MRNRCGFSLSCVSFQPLPVLSDEITYVIANQVLIPIVYTNDYSVLDEVCIYVYVYVCVVCFCVYVCVYAYVYCIVYALCI